MLFISVCVSVQTRSRPLSNETAEPKGDQGYDFVSACDLLGSGITGADGFGRAVVSVWLGFVIVARVRWYDSLDVGGHFPFGWVGILWPMTLAFDGWCVGFHRQFLHLSRFSFCFGLQVVILWASNVFCFCGDRIRV